jgi:hypothetical protein
MSWRLLGVSLLLLFTLQTQAAIKGVKAEVEVTAPKVEIFARYTVSLTAELDEALRNGLTLPFVYEFKLTKPRFYAWYRQVAEGFGPNAQYIQRLSYQSLTKQYRISSNGNARHFNSLDEALSALGTIKNWSVLEGSNIAVEDFAGRLRLKLDLSQLPKTYQVSTLGNENWQLDSGWSELQPHRLSDLEMLQ